MNQIYCGNNLFEIGNKRLGTPYECLKKGIGYGLRSDLTGFNPNYQPIIVVDKWCGAAAPPPGQRLGTPTECLRKGIGVGKRLQFFRGGIQQPVGGRPGGPNGARGPDGIPGARGPDGRPGARGPDGIPGFCVQPGVAIGEGSTMGWFQRWWPVILTLFVGILAAILKYSYQTIILTMIGVLLMSWFIKTITA